MADERFYVYQLTHGDEIMYVGKGSGTRLQRQIHDFGLKGSVIARFKREKDAYAHEIHVIADLSPRLNRHAGGNGNMATPAKRHARSKDEILMNRIGTRAYAARFLLAYHPPKDRKTLEALCFVARHGVTSHELCRASRTM